MPENVRWSVTLLNFENLPPLSYIRHPVFVKKVVRFSKRLPPRFLATSDAPAAG
jgi:hypothetical protein